MPAAAATEPARPTKRPARVDVAKAAALCDLTPAQLLDLLNRRAALIAGSTWVGRYTANPRPLSGTGDEQVWDRRVFQLWALRMGLTKHRGRYLIGHAGIAVMFGWEEQSVRAHIANNPSFPGRVQPPSEVVLFDRAAVLEYAIQHAIVFPDGRPNVGRPHRGDPIPKKT